MSNNRSELHVEEVLRREEKLTSQNGQYHLIVKTEGKLEIHAPAGKVIWSTNIPKVGIYKNTFLKL